MPHRTIAGIKQKYGPVVWLKIGQVNTIVILDADIVNDFFKNHDLLFIDRNIIETMRSKNYHKGSLALAPYRVYWRVMRQICTVEMSNYNRLSPRPPRWPLFGHIFNLGTMPHRTIAGLKQKYGPVVWLKIGQVNTIVMLTVVIVNDFFKNHDLLFIDRNIIDTMRSKNYHNGSLALAPYRVYWRVMRRLCTVKMFVNKRNNQTEYVDRTYIDNMLL
ncbi:Cytochrome [Forsythia ovata]|uniref:Cytochrome n=1 Tax=Forsythia ovata TaxID=205694 RepID=A0ABD1SM46_9LAMI